MSENLVGRWTFAGLGGPWDETENWSSVQFMEDARLTYQGLVVNAEGWARVRDYTGPDIREKTLISWLIFNDLSAPQPAGSALTIDRISSDQFDGLVFGERYDRAWTAGSTNYDRTPMPTSANPSDTVTGRLIKVAATYRDAGNGVAEIKLYHDDQLYLTYQKGMLPIWSQSDVEIIFGKRHTFGNNGPGYLNATIVAAELHNACLSADELKARTVDDPCAFIRPAVSLQSVSNPDRFIHAVGDGPVVVQIDPVNAASDPMDKARASVYIVPGLADPLGVSLMMEKPPGQYICYRNGEVVVASDDGSEEFRQGATFQAIPGLSGQGMSFQLYSQPQLYLRQQSYRIIAQASDGSDPFRRDASFMKTAPFTGGITTELPLDEQHWYTISNHYTLPDHVLAVDDNGVVGVQMLKDISPMSRGLWRLERLSDAGVHRWRLVNNFFDKFGPTRYLEFSDGPLMVTEQNSDPGKLWSVRPIPWMGSDYFSLTNDRMEPDGGVLALPANTNTVIVIPCNLDIVEERWRFTCMGAITSNTYQTPATPTRVDAIDGTPHNIYVARYPKYAGALGMDYIATGSVSEWALQSARTVLTNVLLSLRNRANIARLAGYRIIIVGDDDLDIATYPDFGWKEANDWRGGTMITAARVTEEMMGRLGVTNRPSDITYYRRFDQLVHEFGHSIEMRLQLNKPGENFPWWCQWWFNSNGQEGGTRETFRNADPADYQFMRANVFLANREWYAPPCFRCPTPL